MLAMTDVRSRPEGLPTGLLLAGVGGVLDAYTFVGYSGVFANAQTGNIVLLGVDAQSGHWQQALLHIPPVVAFMLGVALAQLLAQPTVRRIVRRPTRWFLIVEIAVLAAVGVTSGSVPSRVVPGVIAFAAAAQVSTFRSLDGVEYSSTLTTTNLRTWSRTSLHGARATIQRRRTVGRSWRPSLRRSPSVQASEGYAPGSLISRPHGSRPLP